MGQPTKKGGSVLSYGWGHVRDIMEWSTMSNEDNTNEGRVLMLV